MLLSALEAGSAIELSHLAMSHSPVIVEELEDNATPRAEKPRRYTLTVEEERSVYNSEEMKAERDCNRMCLVATQWIVRCLLGVVTLGCLVASRVSFTVMVKQFSGNGSNANVSSSDSKESQFWLLLFAILVPHAFSFVRCVWIGLQLLRINQQTYYPWPSTGAKASQKEFGFLFVPLPIHDVYL